MKKLYTFLTALILTTSVFAQAPEKMSYQAVVRGVDNTLLTSQEVGMQISILQGTVDGTPVYEETQIPTTNINGLVSIEIGSGTVISGAFNEIDWSDGLYFIKTETDPTGGVSYTITGTSQLMSVPYALHANTADSIAGGETDPIFGASIANGITALDTANWNDHAIDTNTQLDSTGVTALGYVAGAHTIDTDTQLDSTGVADLGYIAGPHTVEIDGSITNEIQTISRTGTTVTLSDGGGTFTDSVNIYTAGTNIIISDSNVINVNSTNNFYLGQDTLNGIVFHLYEDPTGMQHGLIVGKNEWPGFWQDPGFVTLVGADRSEDGAYNTALMTGTATAYYMSLLGADWYLPSIDELNILFSNRFWANKGLRAGGSLLISHSNGFYWSSTEADLTGVYVMHPAFVEIAITSKSALFHDDYIIRGIRAF